MLFRTREWQAAARRVFLAAYAVWGVILALRTGPALAPYLAVYGFAFGLVALWGLHDRWELWMSSTRAG